MTESAPASLLLYQDAERALQLLERGSLEWLAPHLLDDPFALDADSTPMFDAAALADSAARAIAAAVFSREPPGGLPGHPVTRVIHRWRAQRRFNSEEEVHNALGVVLPALVERHMEVVEAIKLDWRRFAEHARMLVLHERHTELSLWEQRAQRFRGVALRLNCEEGSMLAAARPVLYQTRRPHVTTLAEQTAVLIGQSRVRAREHFAERLLARPRSAAGHAEWCCLAESETPATTGAGDGREERPFEPEDLRAVYLGPRMAEPQRERLLALVAERYPRTRVLAARLHPRDYALDFDTLVESTTEPAAGEAAPVEETGVAD